MKVKRSASALALALLLAACGQAQDKSTANREIAVGNPATHAAHRDYSGSGTVQPVTGDQVAIAHGPIAGISWPAMTMTFTAPTGMVAGIKFVSRVNFSFRRYGSAFVLTSVKSR